MEKMSSGPLSVLSLKPKANCLWVQLPEAELCSSIHYYYSVFNISNLTILFLFTRPICIYLICWEFSSNSVFPVEFPVPYAVSLFAAAGFVRKSSRLGNTKLFAVHFRIHLHILHLTCCSSNISFEIYIPFRIVLFI